MPGSPPASLSELAARVDRRLDEFLTVEHERWSSFDPELAQPIDEIRRLVMSGGKRLRPAFCHWGYVGAGGGTDEQEDIDAGAAFELMHAFALFHDDVMDDADSRRNQPTTHVVAAKEHADNGWAGESRRFGEGVAILVGDLCFVYADQLLHGANSIAVSTWNELRIELNIGQYLDILGGVSRTREIARAERICRYKSGKYTIERPLHLGSALAAPERADELFPALSSYGLPLGDAFQMRDDVMGAFGDEALTGKPVGGDLVEGKPTPLLARATRRATPGQLEVLDLVGDPTMSTDTIARIQQVIVETGALDELEAHISVLTETALTALDTAPITDAAKSELADLAEYVSQRTT
ncbi:polyprenyl synthetase family protein [Ilumatobacter nonamiensis]|uniref:polyprenyl synthetase family protein n=1 Tax=Ilumatobacter nonamiensis TaxID=467093 RepID=UPI00034B4D18|nr:polyprenyl synthetase family protein [Ilumatobacter nonamiensis]